jgi:hypothetical protein
MAIPLACNLTQKDLSARLDSLHELGETLVAVEAEGDHAVLRFESDREPVERFVAEETRCCPFFVFEVAGERPVTLDVRVPEGGEQMLRSLVAAFVAGWRPAL